MGKQRERKLYMKKKIFIGLGLAGVIAISISIGVYAATDIKLFINGKAINTDLQIVNGSSYVPLRVVTESLGGKVVWDSVTRTISITSGTSTASPDPVTTPAPAATSAPVSSAKSYAVNVNVESGPMKMNVSKVTLEPAYKQYQSFSQAIKVLILDVTVENTSSDAVSWSPAYGVIITNTKEQTQGYHYSEPVGGDFLGNVIKKGKLIFEIRGELSSITGFNFTIDSPIGNDYAKVGEKITTEFLLK
jgi:hypothetical protein